MSRLNCFEQILGLKLLTSVIYWSQIDICSSFKKFVSYKQCIVVVIGVVIQSDNLSILTENIVHYFSCKYRHNFIYLFTFGLIKYFGYFFFIFWLYNNLSVILTYRINKHHWLITNSHKLVLLSLPQQTWNHIKFNFVYLTCAYYI